MGWPQPANLSPLQHISYTSSTSGVYLSNLLLKISSDRNSTFPGNLPLYLSAITVY